MCSRVWFVTDRRISQEYPQVQILRALKERCVEDDVEFRYLLMDEIVITITDGQLGNYNALFIHITNIHYFVCNNDKFRNILNGGSSVMRCYEMMLALS